MSPKKGDPRINIIEVDSPERPPHEIDREIIEMELFVRLEKYYQEQQKELKEKCLKIIMK